VGNIVPAHAREMQEKYGMGLALNSMEGREAKHISIARYSQNTCYQNRWEQVFRHEYISLLWLRERGYNLNKPSSVAMHYIPKRATENPNYCYCGMEKAPEMSGCIFCLHKLREDILRKVRKVHNKA
jgi:hypothetical protein